MIEFLKPYVNSGQFIFNITDDLKNACNAPTRKGGIYIIYSEINNKKEIIYVGSSGHIQNNGNMHVRKTGGGGLKGRIVNGHQFGEKRFISWKSQMQLNKLKSLEIHWFVTHNTEFIHSPIYVESCILQNYFDSNGKLPKWNKKF